MLIIADVFLKEPLLRLCAWHVILQSAVLDHLVVLHHVCMEDGRDDTPA